MNRRRVVVLALALLMSSLVYSQVDKIVIPAGTPEDQALSAINNEQDAQKKVSMYEEFLEKFASNPVAVAYGNCSCCSITRVREICRRLWRMATKPRLQLRTTLIFSLRRLMLRKN